MSLYRVGLNGHDFDQSVESNISNIVVTVRKKLAEYVDSKHTKARIGFDIKNREDGFIKDRIPDILR